MTITHSFQGMAVNMYHKSGHFSDWGIMGDPYNNYSWTLIPCDSTFGAADAYKRAVKPWQEEKQVSELAVFPNPATDNITLTWLAEDEQNVSVQVISVSGKTVLEKTYEGQEGNNTQQLSVKQFTKGLYFVAIQYNGRKEQFKLVIH